MKDILRISFLTVLVFAGGMFTGVWSQRLRLLPPPPLPPLGEMDAFRPTGTPRFPLSAGEAAEMEKALAELRPRMEAFAQKLTGIEAAFRENFEATLTPEQRKTFSKAPIPSFAPIAAGRPVSDRLIGPLEGLAFFTIIQPVLDHTSAELDLTSDQQARLKELLLERRRQFLELLDAMPPPSLQLRRLAPR